MKSTIVLALVTAAACSEARSSPDASLVTDAPTAIDAPTGACPLVVNEVAAAGAPNDWFELVNGSATAVDLAGFRFIDEVDDPSLAVALPATILAPGGRHVQEVADAINGFGLGADDALWLYPVGSTTRCDGADWVSGDAPAGSSWARSPDRTGPFATATPDTRGVPN